MNRLSYVIFGILMLIGGASIASVMFANVAERRRELGTLMALGATPGMISRMILLKASTVGVVGGSLWISPWSGRRLRRRSTVSWCGDERLDASSDDWIDCRGDGCPRGKLSACEEGGPFGSLSLLPRFLIKPSACCFPNRKVAVAQVTRSH